MRTLFLVFLLLFSFILGCITCGYAVYCYLRNEKMKIVKECKDRISELQQNKNIDDEFKKFPKYYINLDRSTVRRNNFEKHMKEYGITNFNRVRAFDGKKIQNKKDGIIDGVKYRTRDEICTNAELAITMSHLIAMKKATDDGCDVAMIMEDDCELTLVPYWKKSINEIVSEIPEDCEIFLLCNRRFLTVSEIKLERVTNPMEFTGVCYLITKKGMNKLTRFFDSEGINLDLNNIVFDQGFMSEFIVYTYNISLFLLENYTSMSTHVQIGKSIPDINRESVEILKNKPFLV